MGTKGDKLTGVSDKSAQELQDCLTPLGDIRIRKMFGGYGVFEADTMFALVDSQGCIFFKADETNDQLFKAAGSQKHGRMPYYQVPEHVLEDENMLQEWAHTSITISKKTKKKDK
jgi:DNA transformation protein